MSVVLNDLLGRPLLKIYQDEDAFTFSLDSMLLASFVSITARVKSICDLCTGNAPVPLYLSLRTKAAITGVEIQNESALLARKSVEENKLEGQISILCDNLKDISKKIGTSKFDVVTCNPPFFKVGENLVNPNDKKAIARHEIMATLEDIVKEASKLLNTKGRFALVHRPERLPEILELFKKYHIEPKRLRFVYPKMDKECNHILIEGIKDGSCGSMVVLPPLYVYNEDNKWAKEILEIYNYETR